MVVGAVTTVCRGAMNCLKLRKEARMVQVQVLKATSTMTVGGVTRVWAEPKVSMKLLEEARKVREKPPMVCSALPGPGVHG